jgi:hypothetical protein
MPLNVNLENLRAIHGDKAESAFREIADLGGFGAVGGGEGQIPPSYAGGLDVYGVLNPENTATSDKAKARIAELAGVDRKKDVEGFTPTPFARIQKDENKGE